MNDNVDNGVDSNVDSNIEPGQEAINAKYVNNLVEAPTTLQDLADKERAEKDEKHRVENEIKKKKNRGAIDHAHPLMTAEMNLLEISHRTIEVVEKYKMNLIGASEGEDDYKGDIESFKQFLFDTLVKLK